MYIYLITNKLNGKQYVGQTTIDDKHYYGGGKIIGNALRKYGKKNFKKEIIEECCCQDQLDLYEIFYIEHFNTLKPNGYNINNGGCSAGKHSEETRKKISKNHADVSGKNNPMYGKVFTEEHLKNMSNSLNGRKCPKMSGQNNPACRPEVRKKISEAHKRYWKKRTNKHWKLINGKRIWF